jgi:hypothetical protein
MKLFLKKKDLGLTYLLALSLGHPSFAEGGLLKLVSMGECHEEVSAFDAAQQGENIKKKAAVEAVRQKKWVGTPAWKDLFSDQEPEALSMKWLNTINEIKKNQFSAAVQWSKTRVTEQIKAGKISDSQSAYLEGMNHYLSLYPHLKSRIDCKSSGRLPNEAELNQVYHLLEASFLDEDDRESPVDQENLTVANNDSRASCRTRFPYNSWLQAKCIHIVENAAQEILNWKPDKKDLLLHSVKHSSSDQLWNPTGSKEESDKWLAQNAPKQYLKNAVNFIAEYARPNAQMGPIRYQPGNKKSLPQGTPATLGTFLFCTKNETKSNSFKVAMVELACQDHQLTPILTTFNPAAERCGFSAPTANPSATVNPEIENYLKVYLRKNTRPAGF